MRVLSYLCILSLLAWGCHPKLTGPGPVAAVEKTMQLPIDTLPFPDGWVGTWAGELHIWKGLNIVQSVSMKTIIAPTEKSDEYHWMTTFGDEAKTEKPYLLKVLDKEKGLYVIDEHNSIVIESYLFDNKLVSWYIVMGSLIQATFEKRGTELIFEILAGSETPVSITGNTKLGEEDIPEVKTLPFNVMQRAVMKRK
jgi:hypothetical protein